MKSKADTDKAILMAAFAKIDVIALAVALGSISALMLFLATVGLLLKGAPPGTEVGPHLALLSVYLPGYSVSWFGAVVGALYAGIIGGFLGFVLAVLWNLTHYLYVVAIVVRTAWWRMMAE